MTHENILYFCNCYLIMINYDEEIRDTISDFFKKELPIKSSALKSECNEILNLPDVERNVEINNIISETIDLILKENELEDILRQIQSF